MASLKKVLWGWWHHPGPTRGRRWGVSGRGQEAFGVGRPPLSRHLFSRPHRLDPANSLWIDDKWQVMKDNQWRFYLTDLLGAWGQIQEKKKEKPQHGEQEPALTLTTTNSVKIPHLWPYLRQLFDAKRFLLLFFYAHTEPIISCLFFFLSPCASKRYATDYKTETILCAEFLLLLLLSLCQVTKKLKGFIRTWHWVVKMHVCFCT